MTERFSMVVREWRSAEVMNDYVFRGINRRNLPQRKRKREREEEKFLHHLNFVRVSGINIHRFHRSNLQRTCNGTRNEIYFFSQNGIVTGNRLWNSQKLVPFFLRSFVDRTEKSSAWNLFCWKEVGYFFPFI